MIVQSVTVSAPGKLMLAGEYAVLRGSPALVTAVDRRAFITLNPNGNAASTLPAEAIAARRVAEGILGAVPGTLSLNVAQLRDPSSDVKLGLGSSAAAAAGAAAAVFAAHGHALDQETIGQVFRAAMQGHHEIAPRGSGADVAAAVLGGFIRFEPGTNGPRASSIQWPKAIEILIIWTGKPARTSDFIAKVEAMEKRDPSAATASFDRIQRAARTMIDAVEAGDVGALIDATCEHHNATAELGERSGAPIVEDRLQLVSELAQQAGGAAKPSGAGGGDAAVAFFPDEMSKDRCSKACADHGLALLSLRLGADGVRLSP